MMMMMMMMMMKMVMNCFCGMVDRRKVFSLISSRYHCRRFSPSRMSNTPRAGFIIYTSILKNKKIVSTSIFKKIINRLFIP